MSVRIYQPPKNAMQSGRAGGKDWLLEFEPSAAREVEPLMGWTSSPDTEQQLRLWFASKEEAIAYCEKRGLVYQIQESRPRQVRPRAYADNFAYQRAFPWTH